LRNTLTGPLPRHLYVLVDSAFTHKEPVGFIPAVWFGLVSYPARAWGATVMLECGAIYRNLPLHSLAFDKDPDLCWTQQDAQHWDCYGWDWSTCEYPYLSGLDVKARCAERTLMGEYLFSVAPVGDPYSAYPEQSKEFTFVRLENDRITVQPTDRLIFRERSFTVNPTMEFPRGLVRQTEVWTTE